MTGLANHLNSRAAPPLKMALDYLSAGRIDSARAVCREVLEEQPRNPAALHLLGVIEFGRGNLSHGRRLLGEAAASPSATAIHLLSYAELCCKPDDLERAIAVVRRAAALDGELPLAWLCLGRLLFAQQDYAQSRRSFEHALKLEPNLTAATCGLANALGRLGHTAAALALFDQLIAKQPVNAAAHDGFALLLQDLGRYPEALDQANEAVAREPDSLDYQIRAADIELHMGRYWPALERLAALGARAQHHVNALTLKSHLLRLVDQFKAAARTCEDALKRGVESAGLLRAYGLALQLDGKDDEALVVFDRAAARSCAAALSDKGVLLVHLGRFDEARTAFQRALERAPTLADAWYNQTNLERRMPGDPQIAAMERLLEGPCVNRDRLLLHFALGKAYMDVSELQTALAHWHHANRLKRASIDYDADSVTRDFATIAARTWDARPPGDGEVNRRSELPVFIVGMPRSGSSLLEQILASHPAVHGGGEQLQLRGLFEPVMQRPVTAGHEETIAALVTAKLRKIAPRALRVIDKDLSNFRHLGTIHGLLPRARIIHCRRDPLDTCFSAYSKLFVGDLAFTYDLTELGRYYRDYHALMAHWRALLPGDIFIDVDYEQLVAEPVAMTRRLLDFLGLDWHDDCTRHFATERAVRTASAGAVRSPITAASVGRTRSLEPYLGPLVDALGPLAIRPGSI